jgi:hypothetical protein
MERNRKDYKIMTKIEADKIIEYIESYYGDCNCDHFRKCGFCTIVEEIKKMEDVELKEL